MASSCCASHAISSSAVFIRLVGQAWAVVVVAAAAGARGTGRWGMMGVGEDSVGEGHGIRGMTKRRVVGIRGLIRRIPAWRRPARRQHYAGGGGE